MARVRIEEVVEHLRSEMRKALADAVREEVARNGEPFDEHALFRAFKRAVGRKCNAWERVSDHSVEP